MGGPDAWRAAHAALRRRADAAAALVGAALAQPLPALPFVPTAARRILTTGVGSSAAHAALLAHLLADHLGLPARRVDAGAFVAAPRGAPADALVVFSQGLSPNARLALEQPSAWLAVLLVCAVAPTDPDPARRAQLAALAAAGGVHVALPGGAERGTLVRLAGPLAGYAVAYRLAAAIGAAAGLGGDDLHLDPARIAAAMAAATARGGDLAAAGAALRGDVVVVASGGYGALAGNLALKIGEGLLQPLPPVCDLIGFAHGPFQIMRARPTTVLALERRGAPRDADLLDRLARMLDPRLHRLLRLPAALPGAQALFEHEAMLNELVLAEIAARGIDQAAWPGRGEDRPLYEVGDGQPSRLEARSPVEASNAKRESTGVGVSSLDLPECGVRRRQLADLAWPDLDAALAAGCRTAVVPLGATEQHGPHLPFATDTMIAEAVAERFCARLDGAVALPAVAVGCSAEHTAFPGTLSLGWDTLRALLADLVHSLARGGFERIVVFSAHGGNAALLREAGAALARRARPARLFVHSDLGELVRVWQRAAAAEGITAAVAGQHAGEFETSILLALRPALVRRAAAAPGRLEPGDDAQPLFYPNLRAHAPTGVVGDPRAASAARGVRYLDAWVDALLAWFEREKKRKKTNGTQKA